MTLLQVDPATDFDDPTPVTITATLLDPGPTLAYTFTDTAAGVTLDAPDAGEAWRLTVRRDGRIVTERTVHFGAVTEIAWADLTDVDPTTLNPSATPGPAWDAALDELRAEVEAGTGGGSGGVSEADLSAAIAGVLGGAGAALDTLAEIDAQLAADEGSAAALAATVATKQTAAQVAAAVLAPTGRVDFTGTNYTIANPAIRFTVPDPSSTDDHAKGLILEWGGQMTAGTSYPYGIATNAWRANNSATFTVPTTGYKKWGWMMTHYQSPASTGETTHQHLNLETVKADWLTVITRLQISFGEDVALVSFPNSDVKVFNDLRFQIGTDAAGAFLKHDTAAAQITVSSPANTPWVHNDVEHRFYSIAAGGLSVSGGVTGESQRRYTVNTSGRIDWGSGAATRDTALYRSAAATLKTDGALVVGGALTIGASAAAVQPTVKRGLAKISGGAIQWGIPSALFNAVSTTTVNANEARYIPVELRTPTVVTAFQFEVTTAPVSAANVAVGIYAADGNLQPTGTPLYDSGSVAVASGFTGVKTTTGLSVALQPGIYLVAMNADVAMTMRAYNSPSPTVLTALGASPFASRYFGSQTFGAFPASGTQWTSAAASAGGLNNTAVFQWTE